MVKNETLKSGHAGNKISKGMTHHTTTSHFHLAQAIFLTPSTLYPLPGACVCGCSLPLRRLCTCSSAGLWMHFTMVHNSSTGSIQLSTFTITTVCHHLLTH
eukprot:2407702-Amphidinium_carterae.6